MNDPLQPGLDCTDDCPVRLASDIISGKWTTLIFRELLSGTKRYTELQRGLLGISPKILASRLQMLANAGLVTRKIYPTVPPKTEYTLTELGREIEPVIRAMADFGSKLGEVSDQNERAA